MIFILSIYANLYGLYFYKKMTFLLLIINTNKLLILYFCLKLSLN